MIDIAALRHLNLLGGLPALYPIIWIVSLGAVAVYWPNTQQVMAGDGKVAAFRLRWSLTPKWAMLAGGLFGISLIGIATNQTTFLYFRF